MVRLTNVETLTLTTSVVRGGARPSKASDYVDLEAPRISYGPR